MRESGRAVLATGSSAILLGTSRLPRIQEFLESIHTSGFSVLILLSMPSPALVRDDG